MTVSNILFCIRRPLWRYRSPFPSVSAWRHGWLFKNSVTVWAGHAENNRVVVHMSVAIELRLGHHVLKSLSPDQILIVNNYPVFYCVYAHTFCPATLRRRAYKHQIKQCLYIVVSGRGTPPVSFWRCNVFRSSSPALKGPFLTSCVISRLMSLWFLSALARYRGHTHFNNATIQSPNDIDSYTAGLRRQNHPRNTAETKKETPKGLLGFSEVQAHKLCSLAWTVKISDVTNIRLSIFANTNANVNNCFFNGALGTNSHFDRSSHV